MLRSRVHMLTVAAARIEQDHGSPKLIADLREAAKAAAKSRAEGVNQDDDRRRIERQRTLFTMLPVSDSVDRLKRAMMQRVYDCMWDGDCAGADAVAEFLPSADAEKAFQAWTDDTDPKTADKSKFHTGEYGGV